MEAQHLVTGHLLAGELPALALPVVPQQHLLETDRVSPGAVELLRAEADRPQPVREHRLPDRRGRARGVHGAVVVEDHHAVLAERRPRDLDVPGDVLVEVGGVYVDEAAALRRQPAVLEHRGRCLDDRRELLVERQVVGLEGLPGERAVGARHLVGVGLVGCVRVEEVADGEGLGALQVPAGEDRAATQVGSEFQQVTGGTGAGLSLQHPGEEQLVQGPEPAGDVVQSPRRGTACIRGTGVDARHGHLQVSAGERRWPLLPADAEADREL